MKNSVYFVLLIILVSVFSGCKYGQEQLCDDDGDEKLNWAVFAIGEQVVKSEALNDIIHVAGLNTRGYLVILTSEETTGTSQLEDLLNALNYFEVHANHVVKIRDSSKITKANEIAIRHAEVVFLVFNSRNTHASFLGDTRLLEALKYVPSNGKTLVGIATGAGLLGEIAITSTRNPVTSQPEIKTAEGLNLLPGTLVDKTQFFNNHKDKLAEVAGESRYMFLGIGNKSLIQYCNQELSIIKPGTTLVVKDGILLDQPEIARLNKVKLSGNDR